MEEKYEPYQKRFTEMAHIGEVDELKIDVYTDHNTPHFHVTKKDWFELQISIKDRNILSYKWQKNGKEISSKEFKNLSKWLDSPYPKNKKVTNAETIQISWDILN